MLKYFELVGKVTYQLYFNFIWRKQCQDLQIEKPGNSDANLISSILKLIQSEGFCNRHKVSKNDFIRNRKLPFPYLILFLLNQIKRAAQSELNFFFKDLLGSKISKYFVSDVAFFKARMKLKPSAFIELNNHFLNHIGLNSNGWHGLRLLAIDGSKHTLPKFMQGHFSENSGTYGNYPSVLISQLYDVTNKLTLDISFSKNSEMDSAFDHLDLCPKKSLILFDRGYPSFPLFSKIYSQNNHFCARAAENTFGCVKDFIQKGLKDKIYTVHPCKRAIKRCASLNISSKPIKVRLVRVQLSSGETEVLMTSLLNKKRFPTQEFKNLYHNRWQIEEDFKEIKRPLELSNLTGKSVESFFQDCYAKIFIKNLSSYFSRKAEETKEESQKELKYKYQINRTQALSHFKGFWPILINCQRNLNFLISEIITSIAKSMSAIRPNREFARKKRNVDFCMNYKGAM